MQMYTPWSCYDIQSIMLNYPNTYYITGYGWGIYLNSSLILGLTPARVDIAQTSNEGTSISTTSDWIHAIDPFMLKRVPLDIGVWVYDIDVNNFEIKKYVLKYLKDSC